MTSVLSTLRERGFVKETTDDAGLEKLLGAGPVAIYAGFDPSAPSLQVGNLVPIMALAHLQRAGHRPIVVMGGGTGMVGDPSGKTEARKLLTPEDVQKNLGFFREQFSRFLDFGPGKAIILDNADWLLPLNYIEFLRDYGRHFRVNQMLTADCFKTRLESESGLSFLEFNYMLLQAYDFLVLFKERGCRFQIGGSDQWGNIVAGIDLIRRVAGGEAYGLTIPLITTASGAKMGKTAEGTIWLAADRTTPYDLYQYWINVDDRDVGRFLRIFTFLPIDEICALEALRGAEIRKAKEVLAFDLVRIIHGADEAEKARGAARALFGGGGEGGEGIPTHDLPRSEIQKGLLAVKLFGDLKLCASQTEARRQARQNGLYVNDEAIAEDRVLGSGDVKAGAILLRSGKKRHLKLRIIEG